MKGQPVPLEWVNHTWPLVEGFLAPAMKHGKGDYELEHVRTLVSTGAWTMLVVVDDEGVIHGVVTLHCFNRPVDRVAFVTTTAGKFIMSEDTVAQLQNIARSMGATALECAARDSMSRLLGRYGFEEKYRILGVKL
jgi:hypothetical protein